MPIKSLESLLFESKLVTTSSLDVLQNATIGIDVEHYLSRIYTFKKEQCLSGIGGVPTSLKQYIQSDLKDFKESNIKPLFVLPGLNISNHLKSYQTNELSPQEQHLDATWNRLHSKQAVSGGNIFVSSGDTFRLNLDPLPIKQMMNNLIKLFIELDVDYLVSPYDTSFQLSYFYQSKVIDCIYGSTDLLLASIDKFILGMEFQSKDFRFVDKQRVLNELNLTQRQFLDLSIMVGCSAQPETFSNLPSIPKASSVSSFSQISYFRMALDILFQYETGSGPPANLFAYISSLNDPKLLSLYHSGHAGIKFMPIMNTNGYVELFSVEMAKLHHSSSDDLFIPDNRANNSEDKKSGDSGIDAIPTELHSVLSQRLPPEFYFYQSLGLLPSKLLEAICSGEYAIRPPLATGEGDGYKRLVSSKKCQNFLDQHFNLITQLLARYYQVKRIKLVYWFRKEPLYLNSRVEPSVYTRLREAVSCQMVHQDSSSLWSIFRVLPDETCSVTSSQKDVLATSFRRALFLMEVLDEKGNLSGVGQTLKRFCEEKPEMEDKTLEDLFLLLLYFASEGLRLVSHYETFGRLSRSFKDTSPSSELSAEELNQIFLISNIFATQKLNIHPVNYQGPISRSLLAFRSHLKIFHEIAQNSLLVSLVDLIVRDEDFKSQNLDRRVWCDLIARMPFYKDLNNTLLGVIAEIYFSACLKGLKQGNTVEKCTTGSRDHLMNFVFQVGKPSHNINLNSVNSVSSNQLSLDFNRGCEFWDHFLLLIQIAGDINPSIISNSDCEFAEGADKIVQMFSSATKP